MRTLYTKLFFTGLWVAVLPYLGFPGSWRRILFVLTGALILYFAYEVRKLTNSKPKDMPDHTRSFSEHDPRETAQTEDTADHSVRLVITE